MRTFIPEAASDVISCYTVVDDAGQDFLVKFGCSKQHVDTPGGTVADAKARIGGARLAYLQLKNTWKSNVLSLKNKIRIFSTNVKALLLYGAETRRTTAITAKRIQTFVNSCLRRIVGNWWHEITSNERL